MARILGSGAPATVIAQDIYDLSATQMHRLGTRVQRGDRSFRYAKAISAVTAYAKGSWSTYHQDIMYAAVPTATAIGSNEIHVTVGAADGPANDGVIAAHALEGGYIVMMVAGTAGITFSILDNTAAVSTSDMTVTIDGELPVACSTSEKIELMGNPYKVSHGNSDDRRPIMGIPMRLVPLATPYHWLQTWGPIWITPQATLGAAQGANNAVFRGDGTVALCTYDNVLFDARHQQAGHVMTYAQAGTQGAPFLFLQITP